MTLEQIQALTDDEIRVRVAELCGIEAIPCTCQHDPWKDKATNKHLPNYPADLNAIQAAILAHADSLPSAYERAEWLCLIESHVDLGDKWPAFIASARTRCEAFLAVMQP